MAKIELYTLYLIYLFKCLYLKKNYIADIFYFIYLWITSQQMNNDYYTIYFYIINVYYIINNKFWIYFKVLLFY